MTIKLPLCIPHNRAIKEEYENLQEKPKYYQDEIAVNLLNLKVEVLALFFQQLNGSNYVVVGSSDLALPNYQVFVLMIREFLRILNDVTNLENYEKCLLRGVALTIGITMNRCYP